MQSVGSILFLLFRLLCYLALVIVVLGFAMVAVLSMTGACPRIDTGAIECTTPFFKELGTLGMGIMLISAFTGLPILLAIAGIIFLIRKLYLWHRGRTQPEYEAETRASGFGVLVLKGIGILFAASLLMGVIGGILGGGAFQ